MTGPHDNYLMFRVGQIHAMVSQIHTRVCANPEAPPSKRSMLKGMCQEFGRTLFRMITPIAWPYLVAAVTGIPALCVYLWKAFTRGWLGF